MHPCFDKMIRIVAPFYRPVSLWVNSTQSVDDNSRYRLESRSCQEDSESCVSEKVQEPFLLCVMISACCIPSSGPMHYHYVCVRLCVWAWSLTDRSLVVIVFVFCGGDEQSHDIYWMRWRCYTDRTKPELRWTASWDPKEILPIHWFMFMLFHWQS